MSQYRKILTIDGGGIKGVFPAAVIARIEEMLSKPLGEYFDLIAGTSTGGIIALALGLRIPAKNVLSLYLERGSKIFPPGRGRSILGCLCKPKWNSAPLKDALDDTFGDLKLGDSLNRLVIPALSGQTGKVYIYKTRHHPRFEIDYKAQVVDVAISTSAAPIYFKPHLMSDGRLLVDGGMWANNPLGMAIVEAIGVLGWPKEEIRALSLGCTTSAFNPEEKGFIRPFRLASYIINLFMQGQSHSSYGTAKILIGGGNIVRVNPETPQGRYSLDDTSRLSELEGLASETIRESFPRLKRDFFLEQAEAFVPYQ
jgi:hypothetical protein